MKYKILSKIIAVGMTFIIGGSCTLNNFVYADINDNSYLQKSSQDGTDIQGGIIYENTTWTKEGSPYKLAGNVQLASSAKLIIDPGVIIEGNGNNLQLYGSMIADANSNESIQINDLNIMGSSTSTSKFNLNMDNVDMKRGSLLAPGNSGHGTISIKNSRMYNLEDYMYIWYPEGEVNISGNVFSTCKRISIGSDYNSYITNNVFYNTNDICTIESWANYNNSKVYVENNTFFDEGIVLKNEYSTSNIVATNNYWNSTNIKEIKHRLYDNNVDLSTPNIIDIEPVLNEPHSMTPKFTPDVILEFNEINFDEKFISGKTNANSTVNIYNNKIDELLSQSISDERGNFSLQLGKIDNVESLKVQVIDDEKERTRIIYKDTSIDIKPENGTVINQGIIREDTTWTKEGSPYTINGHVQLAYGAKLIIEPGVVIEGNGNNLQLYGSMIADANSNESIKINDLNIMGSSTSTSKFNLNMDNVDMKGGSLLAPGNSGHGIISIKNSIIYNLEDYMYIWYPEGEVNISGNVFSTCKRISIGSDYNSYITNNVFYNTNDKCTIESWANYNNSKVYVENNTFFDEGIVLKNKYSTSNIVGKNNYWNTQDVLLIQNRIQDNLTDLSTPNVIEFKPILLEPSKLTPKFSLPEIIAQNQLIKVGDKFDPKSIVSAYDDEDGDITSKIEVVENTVDITTTGEYKVVYKVIDSHGASVIKPIKVVVRSNEKPVITAQDIILKVGDTFDVMSGASASDKEDGDITSKIKVIENTVDTTKAGKYKVVYSVEDSDGNVVTKEILVTVNPKLSIINSIPTIVAQDIALKVGDTFNVMSGVSATDKEDGDITSKIKVVENTVDTTKVGEYKVVYSVTDSQGASSKKTIKVLVRSNEKPVITAQDIILKVGDTFDVMSGASASDKEDGDITSKIKVIENTVDIQNPGKYKVVYSVEDSDGNVVTKEILVTVNTKLSIINSIPKVTAKDITLKVGDKFDVMSGVSASDKEDGNITSKIEVIENTVDTTKVGEYKVVYKVTDSQGASSKKTIKVVVRSNEKPIITAKDVVIKVWDSFDVKSGVSASDKEDGDITSNIKVIENTVDTTKAGKYKVVYSLGDSDGNIVTKEVSVTVNAQKIENVKSFTVSYNSNKITWNKVVGANGYVVYRSTSKNGTYKSIKTITNESTLSYTDTSLATGTTYYYKVRAYKTIDGKKVYSNYSSIVSAKPVLSSTTAKAALASYNSNKISWNKVSGANGYVVYRSTSKNGTYKSIKTITSGSTLSYTNTSLATGTTYYYKVRTYRTVNGKKVYSNYSGVVSAKPVLSNPSLTLAAGTKKATVKWKKISGASGYEVYRASSKSGEYTKVKIITKGSTVSYTNSSLTKNKTYYYKLRAYRLVNGKKVYSSYSSVKSVKTK